MNFGPEAMLKEKIERQRMRERGWESGSGSESESENESFAQGNKEAQPVSLGYTSRVFFGAADTVRSQLARSCFGTRALSNRTKLELELEWQYSTTTVPYLTVLKR